MADESSRVAASFDRWVLLREPLELLRDGKRLTLQELPLQILELLTSRAGQLVTREELPPEPKKAEGSGEHCVLVDQWSTRCLF